MADVGIIGASGYVGAELLRLCAMHPQMNVAWATADSQVGAEVGDLYPNLRSAYPGFEYSPYSPTLLSDIDVVFLALPHGRSGSLVPELIGNVEVIIDLAADFRLQDPALYPRWYGAEHPAPELLAGFAYGLPELFRSDLRGATRVAAPGCYPTASLLALAPLVRAGVIETSGIVVDAASGVSGAGRPAKANTTFCAVDESFQAYGLLDHRHTPEIEQGLGATVLFTPHLAPMNRGILATCYARPDAGAVGGGSLSTAELLGILEEAYADEPFVVVTDEPPGTKATLGSNCAHLTARYDERTGWVMAPAAIDNLVKGAAGQALQCANLALGLDETLGLPMTGLLP
ncbi:MAG: N-acetyl-gamma-glutamyl-phosphate reductase [Actinobacteria bacterium]|nr:N-acetyl-gamma-glutamyl-phosphate reductase [Actinomycetota bacterium]